MIKTDGSKVESFVDLSQLDEDKVENEENVNQNENVKSGKRFGFEEAMNRKILVGVLVVNAIGNLQKQTIPAFLPVHVQKAVWKGEMVSNYDISSIIGIFYLS